MQNTRRIGLYSQSGLLKTTAKEANKAGKAALVTAANGALKDIAGHVTFVNTAGTAFRGLSLGSILLVVAIGLAITFGLMGVINMAHGEMIAIGAYTTYVVQCVFGPGLELSPFGINIKLPGMNATDWLYDSYFIIALPLSFLAAALGGLALERASFVFSTAARSNRCSQLGVYRLFCSSFSV